MNTLIVDAMKLEYLTSIGQWTKTAAAGMNFGTTATALAFAEQQPIDKFNIVGYSPINKQFFNLVHGHGKGISKSNAV